MTIYSIIDDLINSSTDDGNTWSVFTGMAYIADHLPPAINVTNGAVTGHIEGKFYNIQEDDSWHCYGGGQTDGANLPPPFTGLLYSSPICTGQYIINIAANYINDVFQDTYTGNAFNLQGDSAWHYYYNGADTGTLNGLYNNLEGDTKTNIYTGGMIDTSYNGYVYYTNRYYYFDHGWSLGPNEGLHYVPGVGLFYWSNGETYDSYTGYINISYYPSYTDDPKGWHEFQSGVNVGPLDGFIFNAQGDNLWHLYSIFNNQSIDSGILQGYLLFNSVWHHYTEGVDDGVVNGMVYQGDSLWHHYTDGVDDGPFSGIAYNSAQNAYYAYSSGNEIGLYTGVALSWPAGPAYNLLADSLRHHYTSGTDDGLYTGLIYNVSGDNLWHHITNGTDDGPYTGLSLTDNGSFHRFIDGSDDGPYTGVAYDLTAFAHLVHHYTDGADNGVYTGFAFNIEEDSKWHSYSGGEENGIINGYRNDVIGDFLWHHFANGVDGGPYTGVAYDLTAPLTYVVHHYTDGVDGGLYSGLDYSLQDAAYSYVDGSEVGAYTGLATNLQNDSLIHYYVDGVNYTGYIFNIQEDSLWHYYVDGVNYTGYAYNIQGDSLAHIYADGIDQGLVTGVRNDVSPDGLDGYYLYRDGVRIGLYSGMFNSTGAYDHNRRYTAGAIDSISAPYDIYSNYATPNSYVITPQLYIRNFSQSIVYVLSYGLPDSPVYLQQTIYSPESDNRWHYFNETTTGLGLTAAPGLAGIYTNAQIVSQIRSKNSINLSDKNFTIEWDTAQLNAHQYINLVFEDELFVDTPNPNYSYYYYRLRIGNNINNSLLISSYTGEMFNGVSIVKNFNNAVSSSSYAAKFALCRTENVLSLFVNGTYKEAYMLPVGHNLGSVVLNLNPNREQYLHSPTSQQQDPFAASIINNLRVITGQSLYAVTNSPQDYDFTLEFWASHPLSSPNLAVSFGIARAQLFPETADPEFRYNLHYCSSTVNNSGGYNLYTLLAPAKTETGNIILGKDNWNHIAVTRSNNTLRMYVNGIIVSEQTDLGLYTAYDANINKLRISGPAGCKLSNIRVVIDQNIYPEGVTVPTGPLTAKGYGSTSQNITGAVHLYANGTGELSGTITESPFEPSFAGYTHTGVISCNSSVTATVYASTSTLSADVQLFNVPNIFTGRYTNQYFAEDHSPDQPLQWSLDTTTSTITGTSIQCCLPAGIILSETYPHQTVTDGNCGEEQRCVPAGRFLREDTVHQWYTDGNCDEEQRCVPAGRLLREDAVHQWYTDGSCGESRQRKCVAGYYAGLSAITELDPNYPPEDEIYITTTYNLFTTGEANNVLDVCNVAATTIYTAPEYGTPLSWTYRELYVLTSPVYITRCYTSWGSECEPNDPDLAYCESPEIMYYGERQKRYDATQYWATGDVYPNADIIGFAYNEDSTEHGTFYPWDYNPDGNRDSGSGLCPYTIAPSCGGTDMWCGTGPKIL